LNGVPDELFVNSFLEFLFQNEIWDKNDEIFKSEKPNNYKPSDKYYDISFIKKIYSNYGIPEKKNGESIENGIVCEKSCICKNIKDPIISNADHSQISETKILQVAEGLIEKLDNQIPKKKQKKRLEESMDDNLFDIELCEYSEDNKKDIKSTDDEKNIDFYEELNGYQSITEDSNIDSYDYSQIPKSMFRDKNIEFIERSIGKINFNEIVFPTIKIPCQTGKKNTSKKHKN
jgi:hypothetical protein